MTFGKAGTGQYAPRHIIQSNEVPERKVGLLLGIGIFCFPLPFAFVTLAKGYSMRARMFSLGYVGLMILSALIFGDHSPKSAQATQQVKSQTAVSASAAASSDDPAQVELKRSNAQQAYMDLNAASPSANETTEGFNARVTVLYNNWVTAEKAAEGGNWQEAYLVRANKKWDCSELYGSFMHEDESLRQMRVACAMKKEVDQYAPAPTVPALADYILKPKSEYQATAPEDDRQPDQTVGEKPATDEEPKKATIYQGQ